MLTLTLFRHAKSSRADPSLEDFDLPRAARGQESVATFVGETALGAVIARI